MFTGLLLLAFAAAPEPTTDPELEARGAAAFLERINEHDRPYIRMGSTYDVPDGERREFHVFMRVWWRQLTRNKNRGVTPALVPGSTTLYWWDLRSFNWNPAAHLAVALRDKTFREPWVSHPTAERIRLLIGENQPSNFHVVGLISLYGLYRRTYQSNETTDYYDLLFANERFPYDGKEETRPFLRCDPKLVSKENPNGLYPSTITVYTRKFLDVPKNEDEWITLLLTQNGISSKEYEKTTEAMGSRRGAVINGMEDARKDTSYVARNNRLVWLAPFPTRVSGIYAETFDVKKTAGKRDLRENAFTDQVRDKKRIFRDGGELIVTLPAGDGIATLIINGKGERLEVVPGDIAIHTRDSHDRTVRNGSMACIACHGEAYGWIPLNNVLEKDSPNEIDVKFFKYKDKPDRQAAEDYDGFFMRWQDDLKGPREVLKQYWLEATGTRQQNYQDGMLGIQIGLASLKWKWDYDAPLGIEQMVLETGAPETLLRIASSKLILRGAIDVARLGSVPRPAWDEDIFPEIMKILHSKKERVTP